MHVLRHSMHVQMYVFGVGGGLLSQCPTYTQVLAKHVSMLLSVLERLCHPGVEPNPFTLSLTDVRGAPYVHSLQTHIL